MTYGEGSYPWYSYPEALGRATTASTTCAGCRWCTSPGRTAIAMTAAARHRTRPMMATIASDVDDHLAEDGGVGYNVVSMLEGSDPDLAPVLLASHLDAHFRAGLDDTSAAVERAAHGEGDDP